VTKEALETLIRHLELWALIFGALVVIGVAGETVFGLRIWWNNRKLQKIQESENVELQIKLSSLQQKTAEADAKAEGFRLQIAQANERALRAEATAKGFESQIAEANARAAEAKLDLVKFKAPRGLSDDQAKFIAGKLKPFGPQLFDVTAYWEKKESLDIAQRIAEILTALAGWTLEQPKSQSMIVGEVTGVVVSFNPKAGDKAKEAANTLARLLTEQGIEAKTRPDITSENMIKVNKIDLTVGAK
jgi:DNA polymerase III delta prime subunit